MNQLSTTRRAQLIAALVEGNSINSTCRMLGVGKHTVLRLLEDAGSACAAFHDNHVRGVRSQRIQCDEIWSFVGAKMKNASEEQVAAGWGDVWTWTALDADSKLIVSYLVGQRGPRWAKFFMEDVALRVASRIQLTTDGLKMYGEAVEGAFGCDVDYAMLIKLYGNDSFDTKYSPGECIGTETAVLMGNPDPKHISTSFVERQNLTMRMSMRRFTRLTNGFSKKLENHAHQVALYFMHYNFCRIHKTLRVTPAMEAGLTDHVWTLEELCGLIPEKKPIQRIDAAILAKVLRTA
ncbi:MAG TPA: IS1 family transposase [Acidobacteriaceae bacterium]|jgi:IS1 family transposase|nr:IS1 family transposase [Acidobacteriaceae bacterium]